MQPAESSQRSRFRNPGKENPHPGLSGMAQALSLGTTTSTACVACCVERFHETADSLNALIHWDAGAALAEAAASDERRRAGAVLSPLDGVPVAVKDNIDVAGQPTTNGLAVAWTAKRDAAVVSALRARGLIPLGKANMHEGALGATTDNPHHGRTFNPAVPGCTPGGSSGGSAAAVAAGLVPAALGTDTMGSVRLPAAYCGVVGFKPSEGFWPTDGVAALSSTLDTVGPIVWSVEDSRLLAGLPASRQAVRNLKCVVLENFAATPLHESARAAWQAATRVLRNNGTEIRRILLKDYDPPRARRAGLLISEVEAAFAHRDLLRSQPEAFSPTFRAMLHYGAATLAPRYLEALSHIRRIGATINQVVGDADAILSLTTPHPAFEFDDEAPVSQADFTAPANFAGCPAISLPIPVPPGEPPVGLQLMTARGDDVRAHAIAGWVETLLQRELGNG